MVRNKVIGFAKIGQCIQYPSGLLVRQAPFEIRQHANHKPELVQALDDESGCGGLRHLGKEVFSRSDNIFGGHATGSPSRLIHDELEMPQVIVVEFEGYSQSHRRMVLLAEAAVPVL